jgi:hypothetical protein
MEMRNQQKPSEGRELLEFIGRDAVQSYRQENR